MNEDYISTGLTKCNRSLGGFGDNIDRLKEAIRYLEYLSWP